MSRLKDFHGRFGTAEHNERPSPDDIERWRGVVDDVLLAEWEQNGWGSYANGALWLVNPALFEQCLAEWFADEAVGSYVFARAAFGDLLIALPRGVRHLYVHYGKYVDIGKNSSLRAFINFDLDEDFVKIALSGDLAKRSVKKHGLVAADEMFTFEPALALGGAEELKYVKKVKMMPQLSFLAQLHDELIELREGPPDGA